MAEGDHYDERPEGLLDRLDASDFDAAGFLEESQEAERERLEQELRDIEEQLEGRDELHAEIVERLEWKVEWYSDRLGRLYRQHRGQRDGTRERLRDRIERFYTELREEHREHWRDRQDLFSERREIARELSELEEFSIEELL